MFRGKEWGTVLRFWADGLPSAFRNYSNGEAPDRQERLLKAVAPTLPGAGIVMLISLLERIVLDLLQEVRDESVDQVKLTEAGWRHELGVNSWDGWDALAGLVALRHCFAHEYGRVTSRQRPHIAAFLAQLEAGLINVTIPGPKGPVTKAMGVFYSIGTDQRISLHPDGTSEVLRFVGAGLLSQLRNAGHLSIDT